MHLNTKREIAQNGHRCMVYTLLMPGARGHRLMVPPPGYKFIPRTERCLPVGGTTTVYIYIHININK